MRIIGKLFSLIVLLAPLLLLYFYYEDKFEIEGQLATDIGKAEIRSIGIHNLVCKYNATDSEEKKASYLKIIRRGELIRLFFELKIAEAKMKLRLGFTGWRKANNFDNGYADSYFDDELKKSYALIDMGNCPKRYAELFKKKYIQGIEDEKEELKVNEEMLELSYKYGVLTRKK